MADLASLRVFLKADVKEFQRGMRQAQRDLKAFEQGVGKMAQKANIAMASIGAASAGLAVRGIKLAASWEQTSVAFETMLGSADRAKRLLDEMTAFSTRTPFEPQQVIAASKTLISFGFEAEKVNGILQMLGDVSAGTGKDLNELSRLFGKVFVKGKAQAEELNQFVEAGIPIFEKLAVVLDADQKAIFEMASKGKVGFEAIKQAFEGMTGEGGRFFEMMDKQSQTAIGKWSTLKGNLDEFTKVLGQRLLPIATAVLDKLNKIFSIESASSVSEKAERDRARLRGILEKRGEDPLKVGKMSDEEVKAMLDSIKRTDEIADLVAKGVKKGYLEGLSDQQVSKMWIKTFLPDELKGTSKFAKFWNDVLMPEDIKQGFISLPQGKSVGTSSQGDIFDVMQSRAVDWMTRMFGSMQMDTVSTFSPARLARAVNAGSQEAYGMRISGREVEQKKLVKKNTDANVTTAQLIQRAVEEGLTLKNIAIAQAF